MDLVFLSRLTLSLRQHVAGLAADGTIALTDAGVRSIVKDIVPPASQRSIAKHLDKWFASTSPADALWRCLATVDSDLSPAVFQQIVDSVVHDIEAARSQSLVRSVSSPSLDSQSTVRSSAASLQSQVVLADVQRRYLRLPSEAEYNMMARETLVHLLLQRDATVRALRAERGGRKRSRETEALVEQVCAIQIVLASCLLFGGSASDATSTNHEIPLELASGDEFGRANRRRTQSILSLGLCHKVIETQAAQF